MKMTKTTKISVNYNDGVLSLPLGVMDKIENIGENELKLLIYICRESAREKEFEPQNAAVALGISPTEIESALAFLRGAGLIKVSGAKKADKGSSAVSMKLENGFSTPADSKKITRDVRLITDTPPQYSGAELDAFVHSNDVIARLVHEAESEKMFGKPLSHADLNKLVSLIDYFSLDEAYVLQLLSISKDKERPMNYAFKLGADFYSRGILTFDLLLEELAKLEEKNGFEKKMRNLFGIEKRSLTSKEKKFFEVWQSYDHSLVEYAYEMTVDSTGSASMPYMNKILTSFAEKKIRSVEDAKIEQERFRQQSKTGEGSFNEKDFFAIALEGSYQKNENNKDENKKGSNGS